MAQPPQSTPHRDIDGIHQDEERNNNVARDAGESGGDLQRAHEQSPGRPPYADDQPAGEAAEAEAHPS